MSKIRKNDLTIIKKFYNKAKEHNLFYDSENKESRHLEAFLLLSTIFEKVLTSIGLSLLSKEPRLNNLHKKRKKDKYSMDNAITDIFLLDKISSEDFEKLNDFRKDRNKCIHTVFNKEEDFIEQKMGQLFQKHSATFEIILKKIVK